MKATGNQHFKRLGEAIGKSVGLEGSWYQDYKELVSMEIEDYDNATSDEDKEYILNSIEKSLISFANIASGELLDNYEDEEDIE